MGKKIKLDIRVVDKEMDMPIRGAIITLRRNSDTLESEAIGGKASFENLDEGLYTIRAKADGYKDSVFSLGLMESSSFSVMLNRSQLPF